MDLLPLWVQRVPESTSESLFHLKARFDSLLPRALGMVGYLLGSASMWLLLSRALAASPSSTMPFTIATSSNLFFSVASALSSIDIQGVLGLVCFGESLSLLWCSGAVLVALGLFLLHAPPSPVGKEHRQ